MFQSLSDDFNSFHPNSIWRETFRCMLAFLSAWNRKWWSFHLLYANDFIVPFHQCLSYVTSTVIPDTIWTKTIHILIDQFFISYSLGRSLPQMYYTIIFMFQRIGNLSSTLWFNITIIETTSHHHQSLVQKIHTAFWKTHLREWTWLCGFFKAAAISRAPFGPILFPPNLHIECLH